MNNSAEKWRRQTGFSLVELLVVIAIIVIIATIALMQFRTSKVQFSRQNVAMELKTAFERARFDSVKRRVSATNANEHAKVVVNATSFTLMTDVNNNTLTTDAVDSLTTNFSGQNITITGWGSMTFPVTVDYDQRGEVKAIDAGGATVNPIFLVCNATCAANTSTVANSNIVLVTPTGTVNLLSGGSAIPAFSPPPITGVPPATGIKPDVTLP